MYVRTYVYTCVRTCNIQLSELSEQNCQSFDLKLQLHLRYYISCFYFYCCSIFTVRNCIDGNKKMHELFRTDPPRLPDFSVRATTVYGRTLRLLYVFVFYGISIIWPDTSTLIRICILRHFNNMAGHFDSYTYLYSMAFH